MEDMWDIKRVLESQENMHNKVEIQSNLELQSLTLSQLRVQDHVVFKLMHMTCLTSDLGDLHMHANIRR
jgi:hypothetical protein